MYKCLLCAQSVDSLSDHYVTDHPLLKWVKRNHIVHCALCDSTVGNMHALAAHCRRYHPHELLLHGDQNDTLIKKLHGGRRHPGCPLCGADYNRAVEHFIEKHPTFHIRSDGRGHFGCNDCDGHGPDYYTLAWICTHIINKHQQNKSKEGITMEPVKAKANLDYNQFRPITEAKKLLARVITDIANDPQIDPVKLVANAFWVTLESYRLALREAEEENSKLRHEKEAIDNEALNINMNNQIVIKQLRAELDEAKRACERIKAEYAKALDTQSSSRADMRAKVNECLVEHSLD